ncbi:hypothetical protein [Methylobacillus glycogenes]|uniref:hypothetical protein n=1 Tax=Methylobacillus glycogenes TaxID=406 RepID=UPI0034E28895
MALLLSACMVGPDYQRPTAAVPTDFKHVEGWSVAAPADEHPKGAWWEGYGDAELNGLIARLNTSNQTVAQYEAQYRQAFALAQSARGALFPQLSTTVGKTRAGQGAGSSTSSQAVQVSGIRTTYTATLNASWELDIWGSCAAPWRPTAPVLMPAWQHWPPCVSACSLSWRRITCSYA